MNKLVVTAEDTLKNLAALARIVDGFDTSTPMDSKTRRVLDAVQMLTSSKAYSEFKKSLRELHK